MVVIYQAAPSPPCRVVLLAAKAVGAPVVIRDVDVLNGGTRTAEYLRLNPQHSVPTMDDNGLVIAESRAIIEYLSDAYGKTDALFPKNTKKRAVVSARIYFDATSLYPRVAAAYLVPIFRGGVQTEANLTALEETLSVFDTLIGDKNLYLVGEQLTLADITSAVTVSVAEGLGHDLKKYKNVTRWLENAKKIIPGYNEINQKQIDWVNDYLKQKKAAAESS